MYWAPGHCHLVTSTFPILPTPTFPALVTEGDVGGLEGDLLDHEEGGGLGHGGGHQHHAEREDVSQHLIIISPLLPQNHSILTLSTISTLSTLTSLSPRIHQRLFTAEPASMGGGTFRNCGTELC